MKKYFILIVIVLVYVIGFNGVYKYDNDKTVEYVKAHKENKSRCQCAWYCMKAIRKGGCYNCYIYPAYAYNKILPQLGFTEISTVNYVPKRGDVSVLPRNRSSSFGHIAIYDGNKWISDYEQNNGIFPGRAYRENGKFQIFRQTDGWHKANLCLNITDIPDYFDSLFKGYHKIKFK